MVSTVAGGGNPGGIATGYADGIGSQATFNSPRGIAVDKMGQIFVMDYGSARLRMITPSGTTLILHSFTR